MKILAIYVVLILSLSGIITMAQPEIFNETYEILKSNYIISEPEINIKEDYISISIEESKTYFTDPGKPQIPKINYEYTFPLGTQIINTEINIDYNTYQLEKQIIPCEEIKIINQESENNNDIKIDQTIYNSNKLYPEEKYYIQKGAGIKNNEHVLYYTINILPQYNPKENTIQIQREINIEINYLPPTNQQINLDEYDMVIIAPDIFSEGLQSLVEHKNDIGLNTILKTTEEIYDEYEGSDEAEKIKYFIKYALEEWDIIYVFLVGDIGYIPIREPIFYHYDLLDTLLTDLYYSDIYDENKSFCSWDSNGNGVFGEFRPENMMPKGDEIDLYPDVLIGRLPCSNTDQVTTIVNKIITYETETYGASWFDRIIYNQKERSDKKNSSNNKQHCLDYAPYHSS